MALFLTFRLVPLTEVPYLDFPELKFNEHESTEMPFRYVKGEDGLPIMPKVRIKCPVLEPRIMGADDSRACSS